MPKSSHTRNGKVRKHVNRTFGSHMNSLCIDRKIEYMWMKQGKGAKRK